MAVIVKTSESTICRELQRNTGKRGYRPKQAKIKTDKRSQQAAKPIKMTPEAIGLIENKIRFDLSPEQASNIIGMRHGIYINHERIYQHIWADKRNGGDLYTHLRHGKKHRKNMPQKTNVGRL